MRKGYIKNMILFFLYVFLQIFIFNRINLWGVITPMVYILFIFSLPFQTPKWVVILLGFLLGFCIDMFSETLGLNALATLIIAFLRPWVIHTISLRVDREEHLLPIFHDMPFFWYLRYAFLLTFIHHFIYFFVDAFTFRNISKTFMVGLSNTAFTLICIFIIQILFYNPSKRY
jgi:rod shape-determining protein MreD